MMAGCKKITPPLTKMLNLICCILPVMQHAVKN